MTKNQYVQEFEKLVTQAGKELKEDDFISVLEEFEDRAQTAIIARQEEAQAVDEEEGD